MVRVFAALAGLIIVWGLCATPRAIRTHAPMARLSHRFTAEQNPLAAYPEVTVHYFDMEASSPETLRQAFRSRGPIDADGVRRIALTQWHISWSWPVAGGGRADFQRTQAACRFDVILPRWRNVPERYRGWWENFQQSLVDHELGHIQLALADVGMVARQIQNAGANNPALTIDQANQVGFKALDQIRNKDRDYDRTTEHGVRQGVQFDGSAPL